MPVPILKNSGFALNNDLGMVLCQYLESRKCRSMLENCALKENIGGFSQRNTHVDTWCTESHSSEHDGRSCEAALAMHVNFDEVVHASLVRNSQMETLLGRSPCSNRRATFARKSGADNWQSA